ncbi:MAG: dinitrogenase iron-molybdenum cofactor biosynthesis protein [Desulfobacterales bacterium]|nr:NifB/NifX family molybdenum-iron cluster-binding protein [Deltaproteobacteria bacterium]NNK94583.1 dinitrogenase iron-molybdenum cofactor biosynthesis protein [Desulfobacterales bacterium]
MKIAITSQGEELSSLVDPRFGRAPFILVVDTETMEYEALDNSANAGAFKGAGIQAATLIHNKGAQVLMTGYCGPKAFQTLQVAGIKVVSDITGTISEVVEHYKSGDMVFTEKPNAEAHW